MVTETVVKEPISREMIEAGSKLFHLLEENDLPVSASFWFFNLAAGSWQYIIASSDVDSLGPKRAYKKVQQILGKSSDAHRTINLADITLHGPDDPLISLMRSGLRTVDDNEIRFSNGLIKGIPINDAFIYRLT